MSGRGVRLGRARGSAGLFLLAGLVVFVVSVLQAGLLEPFFQRTSTLRVLLPEGGLGGLGPGSQVQLFGSPIGEVVDVVIPPEGDFFAITEINDEARPFIRRDSAVLVRRQFVVAGAAFLDISRGRGDELDWDFPVLRAQAEVPTEMIVAVIEEATGTIQLAGDLVSSLLAAESDVRQMLARANAVTADIAAGEGTLGRFLTDDSLVRGLENSVLLLNEQVEALAPLLADLGQAGDSFVAITDNVATGTETLPELLATLETSLRSVNDLLAASAEAVPTFQAAAGDAGEAVAELPQVLRRTERSLAQLEDLLEVLRRSWLIGGGGAGAVGAGPSPTDVRP